MTASAHRSYWSGGVADVRPIAARLLAELARRSPYAVKRHPDLQSAVFRDEPFWPGDTVRALRWLADRGYVEQVRRGTWRATEAGVLQAAAVKAFNGEGGA